jgi:hypothetical protein
MLAPLHKLYVSSYVTAIVSYVHSYVTMTYVETDFVIIMRNDHKHDSICTT